MEQVESRKRFLGCGSVTQIHLDLPADLRQHQTNVHFRRVNRKNKALSAELSGTDRRV